MDSPDEVSKARPPRAEQALADRDIPGLVDLTESGNANERYWAAAHLGLLRRPHTVAAVGRLLLQDANETVRFGAARVLAEIGGKDAYEPLWQAESTEPLTRAAIADGLGVLGDPRGAEKLHRLVNDPDRDVRAAAVRALGRIGGPGVVNALGAYLEDEGPLVRKSARYALMDIGEPEAVRWLRTNPRRTRLLRVLDALAARRAVARRARWAAKPADGPVDRLSIRMAAGAFKGVVAALILISVAALVVGASLVVIAAIAAPLGAILGRGLKAHQAGNELNLVRARAVHLQAPRRIASRSSTVMWTILFNPLGTIALLAAPPLIDAVTGSPGLATGAACALCVAVVIVRGLGAASVWLSDDEVGTALLIERGSRPPYQRSYTTALPPRG